MSGEGKQSDGYRTHQRTVARFVGRVQPKRSRTNRKPRGRVMVTRRGYGTHQRPVALCAWAGLAQNKNFILRNFVILQIGQRTAFTFTLRTPMYYMLSRR